MGTACTLYQTVHKMVVMENCCCCRVRTACLIFGSLYLAGAILSFGDDLSNIVKETVKSSNDKNKEIEEQIEALQFIGITISKEKLINFFHIDYHITLVNILLSACMIVVASLLIYGVHKAKSKFLVPSLIFFPLDTIVRIIFVIVHVYNLGFLHPIAITINIIFLCGIVFDFFIWLCVYSHRQQIKNQLVDHEEWEGNEKFPM